MRQTVGGCVEMDVLSGLGAAAVQRGPQTDQEPQFSTVVGDEARIATICRRAFASLSEQDQLLILAAQSECRSDQELASDQGLTVAELRTKICMAFKALERRVAAEEAL